MTMLLPLTMLMALSLPCRQPQLAAAHGQLAMTCGAGTAIYFTASADQGKTFSPPVKVAEPRVLALGRHRGPRVAILPNAIVISAVVEDGNLGVWRSTDTGHSWKRAAAINDVPGAAREGLHALVADAAGNLFAAWLDLRAQGTRLYGARSTDGGLTWSKNIEIYASPGGTICQCCDPSLAYGKDGRLWVMWRNVLEGSRDLYAASSPDGLHFDPARKLGEGTWKLNACPMDGGTIAAGSGAMVSAWRREGLIYLAESGRAEHQIGAGKDVTMAQTPRGAYVAWTKGTALEILRPNAPTPEPLAPTGAFVNLTALPDGTAFAAWESGTVIETKHLN
jgi:hypothetical protein